MWVQNFFAEKVQGTLQYPILSHSNIPAMAIVIIDHVFSIRQLWPHNKAARQKNKKKMVSHSNYFCLLTFLLYLATFYH